MSILSSRAAASFFGVALLFVLAPLENAIGQSATRDYSLSPVPFTAVHFDDAFWAPRLEANRTVTIPYDFQKCESTGRIDNFLRAAHKKPGPYAGAAYNDSDVFKVIEGAAYSLALHPDPALEKYLDELIAKIAAVQESDGYLYAARTTNPDDVQEMSGKSRYSNLKSSHELYNVGHLYEAAAAHFAATGKRNLLDVAIKSADHVDREFGPSKRLDPPGHEEIELALVKLYRATSEQRYLNLARFFLDCRGRNLDKRPPYGDYAQDHIPVTQQDHAVGHSVRAGYLFCGMADVAALTGDASYVSAIDRIWENMVGKRMYITGGIGARSGGEAFGDDYELPNKEAYAETCAAIANVLWNQRMFLLHGDSRYVDVLERVIYNGLLSGVSLGGDRFFYVNPLSSDGRVQRKEWFDCSCCPTNVVRFLPSIPGLAYAQSKDALYINLFVKSTASIKLGERAFEIEQDTRYPWGGDVHIRVNSAVDAKIAVNIRIPGWSLGKPVPLDLYTDLDAKTDPPVLKVNGKNTVFEMNKGFARIKRAWHKGDTIDLNLPMPIRRVVANKLLTDDADRVALERGPILYCIEACDNGGKIRDIVLPDDAKLTPRWSSDSLGWITDISGSALRVRGDKCTATEIRAVPYYAWCHRGMGEMEVWIPRTEDAIEKLPLPASASHIFSRDTFDALSDGRIPKTSGDQSIPRFTWWDHKGTIEWVEYDFSKPRKLSTTEIYWFDDTGAGQCRVPLTWRLLYKSGSQWIPVETHDAFGTTRDQFNVVNFDPITTSSLRIEATLQEQFSGGILEWRLK